MKKIQIAIINAGYNKFRIIYNTGDGVINPYTVYWEFYHYSECNQQLKKSKRQLIKYADLKSCLLYIAERV